MYGLVTKKSLRLGVSLRSLTWSLTPFAYLYINFSQSTLSYLAIPRLFTSASRLARLFLYRALETRHIANRQVNRMNKWCYNE